jgi:hypothetical protein
MFFLYQPDKVVQPNVVDIWTSLLILILVVEKSILTGPGYGNAFFHRQEAQGQKRLLKTPMHKINRKRKKKFILKMSKREEFFGTAVAAIKDSSLTETQ